MLTNFGKPGHIGAPHVLTITHPLADEVSFFEEPMSANHCEAAFFMEEEWVIETIPELENYADIVAGDTRVYRYIPRDILNDFLWKYSS